MGKGDKLLSQNDENNENDSQTTTENTTETQSSENNVQNSTDISKDEIISKFENDIAELEKQNEAKDKQIEEISEKTSKAIVEIKNEYENKSNGKNSDDIAPGIRKTKTFSAPGYKNGYTDGTVKAKLKELREAQAKAKRGTVSK